MSDRQRIQTRANGDRTRALILDAAENQFGARGFDAVSLRDITDTAGVTLALASYHFGTKDNLFEQVVARRAGDLCEERMKRLAALSDPGVTEILDAFIAPLFERARSDEPGWSDYFRVLARLGESNRWLDTLHRNYDGTAQAYIAALVQILPQADPAAIARGFTMVLQVMLSTVAQIERVDRLTDGKVEARRLDSAYDVLLRFATAGLEALSR